MACLSKWQKAEVRAFCRQYPEWKKAASDLLHLKAQSYEPSAHSSLPGSPVFKAVVQREELLRKIAIIDMAAAAIDGGAWKKALIKNACYGVAYDLLDQKQLPTSHRQAFYHARMAFYVMIWESRQNSPQK